MSFIKFLSFISLLRISVGLECGQFTNLNNVLTERIVGGTHAALGEFPWQVSMQRQSSRMPKQWMPGPATWPAPGVWQPPSQWIQPVQHTIQINPTPPGGWPTPPSRPIPYPPGQMPGQIPNLPPLQTVKPQPVPQLPQPPPPQPIPQPIPLPQPMPTPQPQPIPQPQPQPPPPAPQPQPQPHPQPRPPVISTGRWQHFCGGSVINENWILTAAHCVESMKYSYTSGSVRIVLGTIDWRNVNTGNPQIIPISRIVVHDGWNRNTGQNDIALLHTSTPIQFETAPDGTVLVNKVCLSTNINEYAGNAVSSGWGYLNKNSRVSPDLLRKVDLPIVDLNTCRNAFSRVIGVTANQVCAGQAPKGNCMGDSGGPLIQSQGNKATQIGIVSFSIPCAVHGYPDVFTKVAKYLDWINQQTANTIGYSSMG